MRGVNVCSNRDLNPNRDWNLPITGRNAQLLYEA